MRTRKVVLGVLSLLLVMIWVSSGSAEIPRIINYQGLLTDTAGNPVPDGEHTIRFRIWSDSSGGTVRWTSQPEQVLVLNGLLNYQLGSVENIPPSTFNDTSLWLGITVGTGPEVPELTPRTRLVAAPYAFSAWKSEYSAYADSAFNVLTCAGGWIHLSSGPALNNPADSVAIGTPFPAAKLDVVGTAQMTGFKMPIDASDGYVLTSDVDGNGTWQAAASGRIVNIVSESVNDVTHISDGTIYVNFPALSFSDAPDVIHCSVVLREAGGPLQGGMVAHANVEGITSVGFGVEVVDQKGSSTTINDTDVTVYYLAIQLD
jgi:hypothetical protein